MLGSIDANRGDYQNGWDTDQFPNSIEEAARAMIIFLKAGGLQGGGVNFDAKIRRNSTDMEDLFFAHIGGADTFARGLIVADKITNDPSFSKIVDHRYDSFNHSKGSDFENGKLKLSDLYESALQAGPISAASGKQERLENIINQNI
jgi:xylose isomerase